MTRGRFLLLVLAVVAVAVPATPALVGAATGGVDVEPVEVHEPTEADRAMRADLVDLADAWAVGGGTFGYPFWEKAGQNWSRRTLATVMYREYVTGYRDRLVPGCSLIDAIDVDGDVAGDVKELVSDSCSSRVKALRGQQRWLDAQIEREQLVARDALARRAPQSGVEPDSDAASAIADRRRERAELEERIVELDAAWREPLQESYRDARLAMNLAQDALAQAGLEPLAQDAFI